MFVCFGFFCLGSAPSQDVDGNPSVVQDEHNTTLKNLEHQYEASRFLTHVARGTGLGYGHPSTSDHTDVDK